MCRHGKMWSWETSTAVVLHKVILYVCHRDRVTTSHNTVTKLVVCVCVCVCECVMAYGIQINYKITSLTLHGQQMLSRCSSLACKILLKVTYLPSENAVIGPLALTPQTNRTRVNWANTLGFVLTESNRCEGTMSNYCF